MTNIDQQRKTQHKRFVRYGTPPKPSHFSLGNYKFSADVYKTIIGWGRKINEKCWASFIMRLLIAIIWGGFKPRVILITFGGI